MSNILRSQDRREDVLAHVASNLRRLRQSAGLSQEGLATRSGTSRRTISGLEAGDTNVSLATLDRLAEALSVDFVAMVADPSSNGSRIEAVAWRGEDADSVATILGRVPATRKAELWSWSLAPTERYVSEPDPVGWHEMVAVTEGILRIEKEDGWTVIERDGFAIYSSAQRYAYANAGPSVCRFIRTVVS